MARVTTPQDFRSDYVYSVEHEFTSIPGYPLSDERSGDVDSAVIGGGAGGEGEEIGVNRVQDRSLPDSMAFAQVRNLSQLGVSGGASGSSAAGDAAAAAGAARDESSKEATWSPGHPVHWNQGYETARLDLTTEISSFDASADEKFLAVGLATEVIIYRMQFEGKEGKEEDIEAGANDSEAAVESRQNKEQETVSKMFKEVERLCIEEEDDLDLGLGSDPDIEDGDEDEEGVAQIPRKRKGRKNTSKQVGREAWIGSVCFLPFVAEDRNETRNGKEKQQEDKGKEMAGGTMEEKKALYTLLVSSTGGGGDQEPELVLFTLDEDGRKVEQRDEQDSSNSGRAVFHDNGPISTTPKSSGTMPRVDDLISMTLDTILPLLPSWTRADLTRVGLLPNLEAFMTETVIKYAKRHEHIIRDAKLSGYCKQPGASPFSPSNPDILAYITGVKLSGGRVHPNRLYLYSISKREIVHDLKKAGDRILSYAFSPNGKMIAYVSWDQYVRIFDVETGEMKFEFGPSGGQMWIGAWSPDSSKFAATRGSPTSEVYIWDVSDEAPHMRSKVLGGEEYIVVDRDPTSAGTVGGSAKSQPFRREPVVLDASRNITQEPYSENPIGSIPPTRLICTSRVFSHPNNIGWCRSISFSPDAKLLAMGSRSGFVFVIDCVNGEEMSHWEIGFAEDPDTIGLARSHRWIEIQGVRWSEDGKELIWRNGIEGGIELWDLKSNRRKRWGVEKLGDVAVVGNHAGGELIVLGDKQGRGPLGSIKGSKPRFILSPDMDGCVRVWKMDDVRIES